MNSHRRNSGFSLTELVVVIAIISILLGIVTLNFHDWQVKHNVEAQVKQMATDISELRVRAMTRKQRHSVTINPNRYVFKSYSTDEEPKVAGTIIPGGTFDVSFQLYKNSTTPFTGAGTDIIEIDSRGMLVSNGTTIYVNNAGSASLDCLTLSIIRVNVGKKNATWSNCDDK